MNKPKTRTEQLIWLDDSNLFPPLELAWPKGSQAPGLLAAGGDLSCKRLLSAYRQGIFPWFSPGQPILWWSTDPRMVLEPQAFKVHRSMRKTLRSFIESEHHEIRIDHDFLRVVTQCAKHQRPGQDGTWITEEMIAAYHALHQQGHAHSFETWSHGRLIGGLYLVAIGGALYGESMFANESNASKIALAALVCFARVHGFDLIDCQQQTQHLSSLGGKPMDRAAFLTRMSHNQSLQTPTWVFDRQHWQALEHASNAA